MLHGNVLLHGWWATDVSFYTTELPAYVGRDGLRRAAPRSGPYRLRADLHDARAARRLRRPRPRARGGRHGRALIAAGVILAPQPTGPTQVLLGSPDHVGTGVPVLLLLLLLDWARAQGGALVRPGLRAGSWWPGRSSAIRSSRSSAPFPSSSPAWSGPAGSSGRGGRRRQRRPGQAGGRRRRSRAAVPRLVRRPVRVVARGRGGRGRPRRVGGEPAIRRTWAGITVAGRVPPAVRCIEIVQRPADRRATACSRCSAPTTRGERRGERRLRAPAPHRRGRRARRRRARRVAAACWPVRPARSVALAVPRRGAARRPGRGHPRARHRGQLRGVPHRGPDSATSTPRTRSAPCCRSAPRSPAGPWAAGSSAAGHRAQPGAGGSTRRAAKRQRPGGLAAWSSWSGPRRVLLSALAAGLPATP